MKHCFVLQPRNWITALHSISLLLLSASAWAETSSTSTQIAAPPPLSESSTNSSSGTNTELAGVPVADPSATGTSVPLPTSTGSSVSTATSVSPTTSTTTVPANCVVDSSGAIVCPPPKPTGWPDSLALLIGGTCLATSATHLGMDETNPTFVNVSYNCSGGSGSGETFSVKSDMNGGIAYYLSNPALGVTCYGAAKYSAGSDAYLGMIGCPDGTVLSTRISALPGVP